MHETMIFCRFMVLFNQNRDMALPVITLKHLEHRGGEHIALCFDYDQALILHIKKIEGAKWSASHKCWYVNSHTGIVDELFKHFKNVAELDNRTKYAFGIEGIKAQQLETRLNEEVRVFKRFLMGRRYSQSTIGTYTSFVSSFLHFTKKDINYLKSNDIERYCEDVLAARKSAISTQRQFIGAMKHLKNYIASLILR